jgi:hypothetical protein
VIAQVTDEALRRTDEPYGPIAGGGHRPLADYTDAGAPGPVPSSVRALDEDNMKRARGVP